MIHRFDGGPVGLDNIAASIGEESGTIEDVIEPHLIQQGYLQRTPRGRIATLAAYRHLGVAARSRAGGGLFETMGRTALRNGVDHGSTEHAAARYTYGEYLHWPDDVRYELIDGQAWMMAPAPTIEHQDIAGIFTFSYGKRSKALLPC